MFVINANIFPRFFFVRWLFRSYVALIYTLMVAACAEILDTSETHKKRTMTLTPNLLMLRFFALLCE